MHTATLACAATTAALTVALCTYAALIFTGIAVAIYDIRGIDAAARSPQASWSGY